MNLLADYVQPLTNWLQANPNWSLFITFIISLTESLAIVGSIVPGSVTMTAVGILAGSGIMRVDLTLLAAILGAVGGDSLSYAIGYVYSDRLAYLWPFNKYPNLLKYGKEFFEKHGGKSVLIGRFIGPLRSIIPVIAGIMHMKQWRFLIANILSAIGWSLLYIMPGVLIGAAGHELSAEGATRFFILILLLLVGIWFIGLIIKALFIKINSLLQDKLHEYWFNQLNHSKISSAYLFITPAGEKNHYTTAIWYFSALICLFSFLGLFFLSTCTQILSVINTPIYFFAQSIHTSALSIIFIIFSQLISSNVLITLFIVCIFWGLYQRNFRLLAYLIAVLFMSLTLAIVLGKVFYIPRPQGLLVTMPGSSFPAINVVVSTAFYGFLLLYICINNSFLINIFKTFILIILGLSGFALLYLNDHWFTDILASFLLGSSICLFHWLLYRKKTSDLINKPISSFMIVTLMITIVITTLISSGLNLKSLMYNHAPYIQKLTIAENSWWNQSTPILPLYRFNRVGQRMSLMNIQYKGDLELLKNSLEGYGWRAHNETFFAKLMMRMNNTGDVVKLPLFAQLYENKSPKLIMTYKDNKAHLVLELTLWESNYNLDNSNQILWVGTVHQNKSLSKSNSYKKSLIRPLSFLIPALNQFTIKRIHVPHSLLKTSSFPTATIILLIKSN